MMQGTRYGDTVDLGLKARHVGYKVGWKGTGIPLWLDTRPMEELGTWYREAK